MLIKVIDFKGCHVNQIVNKVYMFYGHKSATLYELVLKKAEKKSLD